MMIPGMMAANNSMLASVMNSRQGATGDSYAELSMNGRRVATNMRAQQSGQDAVREMRVNAKKTEESIEEQVAAMQEKKAIEKAQAEAEAQRISQTGQSTTATKVSTQGDTVEISDAGQQAAQVVAVARTPAPAQASTSSPAAEASEQSTPQVSGEAAPPAEEVDVTV